MNNDDIDILNLQKEIIRKALAERYPLDVGKMMISPLPYLRMWARKDSGASEAGRAALAHIAAIEDERDTAQQTATYLRRDLDAVIATKRTLEADVARLGNDAARLAMERDAARAEVADLIAMLDGMQSMLTQAGRVAARAEADHVATIGRLSQAERERDEVGIQLVAARERLVLAMAVVEAARVYRDEDEVYLDRALAALDDVPGDVKAP
jgi:chromosome segregation ATPase